MSVGTKIKSIRTNAKMSQEELAVNLNEKYGTKIVKSMISKWENNKEEPRMEFIRNIADFFSVSLDYLLGLSDTIAIKKNTANEIESNQALKQLFDIAVNLSSDDLKALTAIAKRLKNE